ncbi:N-lysine methyltransferase setd6 [Populus alba x Populus x berolinensis]|nr:N-lysine methyltransferase setd6 [Populus alba x Populus x berolinensis]
MSSRRLRAFKRWMISQGIEWSNDTLQFIDTPEEGISVNALWDLKEGDLIAKIPKTACLTIKTSGAQDLIESTGLDGYLGLSVALMYEKSLGGDSPWAGYLQVLPDCECLPLVWSLDEVDLLLRGTELHKIVKEDKALIYEDWKESILPLLDSLPSNIDPKFFSVEQYFAAKSLIASRSFEIDDYHGFGMVPLADIFNHKTGAEDVHFTSTSSHSESDDDSDNSDTVDLDADSIGNKEPSSELDCSSVTDDDPSVLEMIMVKDVKAGVEVFNTYGLLGNAALLHRYGFTEPDNSFGIVNIDLELVQEWSSSLFSSRFSRARLSLWRRLEYRGCDSQSAEYFEISSNGEPQMELLILLYIILLPEDTYRKLDLAVSAANNHKGSIDTILSEKWNITWDKISEMRADLLLTESVCNALLWLADKRESLYGSSSIKDDIEALEKCCTKERKLYHSLILRASERRILEKLRTYAAVGARSHSFLKSIQREPKRKRSKRS